MKVIEKCIVDTDFADVEEMLEGYSRECEKLSSLWPVCEQTRDRVTLLYA